MKYFVILFLLAVTSVSFASTIRVEGRTYTQSPGYYSATYTQMEWIYINTDLPWDTVVTLNYGLVSQQRTWAEKGILLGVPVGPFTWKFELTKQIASRGSGEYFNGVNYIFRIIQSNDSISYDKGSASRFGHYTTQFADYNSSLTAGGRMIPLKTEVIIKD